MKKQFFKILNKINQKILPKYSKKDPLTLTKFDKAIVGWKYFVLINSLD